VQRSGTPGTFPKNGSALTGRKGTWIMPKRWLVKTNSGVCCGHTSSCAPVGRLAGGCVGSWGSASLHPRLSSCLAFGA
jgi:hypothetical protein